MLFSLGFTKFKISDVNGDGFPDLILYNSVNAIGYLLLGDGAGSFPTGYSVAGVLCQPSRMDEQN